jgi:hypothetical protein
MKEIGKGMAYVWFITLIVLFLLAHFGVIAPMSSNETTSVMTTTIAFELFFVFFA